MPFAEVKVTPKENGSLNVFVRFDGCATLPEVKEYLNKVEDVYKKNTRFRIIYDATCIGWISKALVDEQVTFMRKHDEDTKRLIERCAIVINSSVAKGMLDLIFIAKPPACELKVFRTVEEARNWMKK